MLENVILFLLSTTKILLKKSYNSAGCSFNFYFFDMVVLKLKIGFEHLRVISAFMS